MEAEVSKKVELINISRELFFTKGYSKTSIQNIIDKAEIAKGTFYHYFKSKEELLNQLTNIDVSALYNQVNKVLEMNISAIEKLNTIFQSGSSWKSENIEMMKMLTKIFMSDSNLLLRHSMLENQIIQLSPVYRSIIEQGVREGDFSVNDSEYVANFILSSFSNYGSQMFKILDTADYTESVLNEFKTLMTNYEDMLERILGCKNGVIHIVEDSVLEKLLKGLLEA